MKKTFFIFFLMLILCVLFAVGCNKKDSEKNKYSINPSDTASDHNKSSMSISDKKEETSGSGSSEIKDADMGDKNLNRILDVMSEFGGYKDVDITESMHVKTFDEFDAKTFNEYVQKLKDAGFTKAIMTKTNETDVKMYFSAKDDEGLKCEVVVKDGESRLSVYADD